MDIWAPEVLQELAKHYRVIVFDNRGMGETSCPRNVFSHANGDKLTRECRASVGSHNELERYYLMGKADSCNRTRTTIQISSRVQVNYALQEFCGVRH